MKIARSAPCILLLENDVDLADSICAFLEDSYRVYVIQDPSELSSYVSRYHINLIISDVDAHHPNLEKILRRIKTDDPQIKVLLMYLFMDEDEVSDKSIFQDADDIILKPFDVDVLRNKLDKLYQASQLKSLQSDIH
jgi:DNA-binding response OmpR family regulator